LIRRITPLQLGLGLGHPAFGTVANILNRSLDGTVKVGPHADYLIPNQRPASIASRRIKKVHKSSPQCKTT
jgi:hypothetical protein